METKTASSLDAEMEQYGRELGRMAQTRDLLGDLLWIYAGHPGLIARNRRLLEKMRLLMEVRCAACPDAVCIARFYPGLVAIRDSLAAIYRKSQQSFLLAPLRGSLDRLAADWDDLVEDCALAKDREVRRLIFQIADAL